MTFAASNGTAFHHSIGQGRPMPATNRASSSPPLDGSMRAKRFLVRCLLNRWALAALVGLFVWGLVMARAVQYIVLQPPPAPMDPAGLDHVSPEIGVAGVLFLAPGVICVSLAKTHRRRLGERITIALAGAVVADIAWLLLYRYPPRGSRALLVPRVPPWAAGVEMLQAHAVTITISVLLVSAIAPRVLFRLHGFRVFLGKS